jgi:hypothetical protein
MKFAYPEFLFALSVISIPIIIHLFNFRRFKKIYFSDIRFLKEIKEQTQNRNRIKHLLVLLCRILAFAFLVFAFARPFIPGPGGEKLKGKKAISVYIDNSYSMEAKGKNGQLLQIAKQKALQLADEYSENDLFQLVTNNFDGLEQRLVNKEEFKDMVQEVKVSTSSRKMSEVISRITDIQNNEPELEKRIVILSDFQKSTADLDQLKDKKLPRTIFLPLNAAQKANVYIDSVWYDSPLRQLNASERLNIRIKNLSDKQVENAPMRLMLNGSEKSIGSFAVEPNSYVDTALFYSNSLPGIIHADVFIGDVDFPYDDHYYFSYSTLKQLNVLNIYGDHLDTAKNPINKLFAGDAFYKINSVPSSRVDYSKLNTYNFIILNEPKEISSGMSREIKKFIDGGGTVAFFPDMNGKVITYNDFLNSNNCNGFNSLDTNTYKLQPLKGQEPFFRNIFEKDPSSIDLPRIKAHYSSSQNLMPGVSTILALQNAQPVITRYSRGIGQIFVSSVPLSEKAGNFTRHAVFVPIVLRMAEWSQTSKTIAFTIGKEENISIVNKGYSGEKPFEIVQIGGEAKLIPESRNNGGSIDIYLMGQIKDAGNYQLNFGEEAVIGAGFNFDRQESDLSCISNLNAYLLENGMENFLILEDKGPEEELGIEKKDRTKEYWQWCIILALIFLLAESMILRLWKE